MKKLSWLFPRIALFFVFKLTMHCMCTRGFLSWRFLPFMLSADNIKLQLILMTTHGKNTPPHNVTK